MEGCPDARAAEEQALRSKWARKAMDVAGKAGLPICTLAHGSQTPERVLMQVCQGKRARALEQRCRAWTHADRYFETTFNKHWPPHVGAVLAYIGVLAEGGDKPAKIDGFRNARSFF